MKVFSATDVGRKRNMNQDYIYASADPVGNLPNLFIVADGMGGHNAGDFASHYGVSTVVETIKKDRDFNPVKVIRNGVEEANRAVLDQARKDASLAGMGTTMVAATVVGEYLYVANVGDSRLYYTAGGRLKQLTQDHSLVAEMVRLGELTTEEAQNHPDKNIITRAIGTSEGVVVDMFDHKLEEGTKLVMCSDGLSNMVSDEDIYRILQEDPEDASLALIAAANENGGKDNIAVIVVDPFA